MCTEIKKNKFKKHKLIIVVIVVLLFFYIILLINITNDNFEPNDPVSKLP